MEKGGVPLFLGSRRLALKRFENFASQFLTYTQRLEVLDFSLFYFAYGAKVLKQCLPAFLTDAGNRVKL